MAIRVLITQQRICNFRYHCLAQLQVITQQGEWFASLSHIEIYMYLKAVILMCAIRIIESLNFQGCNWAFLAAGV